MNTKEKKFFYSNLFREVIDNNTIYFLDRSSRNFPKASCGFAADVLGSFLYKHGYKPINRVHKLYKYDRVQSHTWLEYSDLLIDITADQFNDRKTILNFFGKKNKAEVTRNKESWYENFNKDMDKKFPDIRNAHFSYLKADCPKLSHKIERDYLKILEFIDEEHWPDIRKNK